MPPVSSISSIAARSSASVVTGHVATVDSEQSSSIGSIWSVKLPVPAVASMTMK